MNATVGELCPLQVLASDGNTGLVATGYLYDPTGALLDTVNLPHLARGLYGTTYVFSAAAYYTIGYQLTAGVLVYEGASEVVRVSTTLPSQLLDAGSMSPQDLLCFFRERNAQMEAP